MSESDEARFVEELKRLHDGLLYWFYERRNRTRSRLYADLLDNLLRDVPDKSISSEESRSLIAEVRGNIPKAIRHREKEIELIRRVQKLVAGKPGEEYVMHRHGYDDLSDRIDLLATLYHEAGKTAQAMALLEESRALCEAHGIPFDGADLYEAYREEIAKAPPRRKRAAAVSR